MIINTAGEYTLQYTATDACGNSTTVQRDLVVDAPPRTVLYTDGTFIINESSRDIEANIQAHGQPTNIYDPFDPNGNTDAKKYIFTSASQRPWNNQSVRNSIVRVEIGSNISPTSTEYWFQNFTHCESMDMSKLDTSNVTKMANMFNNCSVLEELDVSGFDTSNVTDMSGMFASCNRLESLDVSGFNTSKVTKMNFMFLGCPFTELDVSGFDTSNVTDMSQMFVSCNLLSTIDVTNFNTSKVEDMSSMFTSCAGLTSLDVSSFDTSSVTTMQFMFRGLTLTELDVSSFDTSSVENTNSMFRDCTSLTKIYASPLFVVSQVTSSAMMFDSSTHIVGGAGTTYNSSYTDKTYAKIDGGVSDPGYFTSRS